MNKFDQPRAGLTLSAGSSVSFSQYYFITNSSGPALEVGAGADVTLVNAGTIAGGGLYGQGLYLLGGGTLINSGTIVGAYAASFLGPATVYNSGTIIGGAGARDTGLYLGRGGCVLNAEQGRLEGAHAGLELVRGGTADNYGDIGGSGTVGYGVLAAGENSQVIQLPVLSPDADTTERTAKFELDPDGTLKGDVTLTRLGASSWRLRDSLTMESPKEQRKAMEQSLQRDFSAFTLDEETTKTVRQLDEPVTVEYQVTAPSYAKSAGSLLLVRPCVVGDLAWGLQDKPRTVPISFNGVGVWRDNFDVKIPAGYTVDDVPDPVNVDAGFATYSSGVKVEGDVLHYQREYVLKKLRLAPAEYGELRKLEAASATVENSAAVLKKK